MKRPVWTVNSVTPARGISKKREVSQMLRLTAAVRLFAPKKWVGRPQDNAAGFR
jgi:hypothetical protein